MDDFNNNYYHNQDDNNRWQEHYSSTGSPIGPELRPKKKKGGAAKILALVLACAIVGTAAGAGGAALKLLQESGIPEAKDYAGFPVGGQFLVSENPDVVNHHLAKVYGKASVGAPPMSVPHIDTRVLDGKRVVLFGPFATFSAAEP